MVVISTIIVVISAVSVYDYYSARNWQQVTSPNRNDVVFENRNQKYGAYTLRRDYDKRVMLILLSFISSIGISYGAFLFFREPIVQATSSNGPTFESIPLIIPQKEKEPEKPKEKAESKPKEDLTKSQNFITPVVVDNPVIDPKPIVNDSIAIGLIDNPNGKSGVTPGIGGSGGNDFREIDSTTAEAPPTDIPDVDAKYIGGDIERINFIMKKINFPEEGFETGGKCYLKFVVDKQGDISSVNVEKGVPGCESCDKEAVRVVKMMPRWKPAETKGKKVSSYFRMVINFVKPRD